MVCWVGWLRPGLPRLLLPDGAGQQEEYGMGAGEVGLAARDVLWVLGLGGERRRPLRIRHRRISAVVK